MLLAESEDILFAITHLVNCVVASQAIGVYPLLSTALKEKGHIRNKEIQRSQTSGSSKKVYGTTSQNHYQNSCQYRLHVILASYQGVAQQMLFSSSDRYGKSTLGNEQSFASSSLTQRKLLFVFPEIFWGGQCES